MMFMNAPLGQVSALTWSQTNTVTPLTSPPPPALLPPSPAKQLAPPPPTSTNKQAEAQEEAHPRLQIDNQTTLTPLAFCSYLFAHRPPQCTLKTAEAQEEAHPCLQEQVHRAICGQTGLERGASLTHLEVRLGFNTACLGAGCKGGAGIGWAGMLRHPHSSEGAWCCLKVKV